MGLDIRSPGAVHVVVLRYAVPSSASHRGVQMGWRGGFFRYSPRSARTRTPAPLRLSCPTYSTSTTQQTARFRCRRVLSVNAEFLLKSELWILATFKLRSVFISSTLAFFNLDTLLTVYGEWTPR